MHYSFQQLETFTTQQATLQASINALQPLVLVAERLSTRLESFESATANALAKLEGLVVEIASSLDDIKHPRDTPNKRYPSVSPPQSPEFPPFKRRKLDLTPSSPEIIPNSQPNSVGEDDSNDESNSSNMPMLRFSAALPLLHQTPPTLIKQAKYKLDNQLPIVLVSSPPEKQNTNRPRSASSRSLENTNRIISPPLATNITEHPRASFPQSPQIGPGPQVEDFRKTPDQVSILSHYLQDLPPDLWPDYPADYQSNSSPTFVDCAHRNIEHGPTTTSCCTTSLPVACHPFVCAN